MKTFAITFISENGKTITRYYKEENRQNALARALQDGALLIEEIELETAVVH